MIRTVGQLRDALAAFPDDMHLCDPVEVTEGTYTPAENEADPYYQADGPSGGSVRVCHINEIETEAPLLDWRMPTKDGCTPVAQSYGEGWDLWLQPTEDADAEYPGAGEVTWPFRDNYEADDEDMKALGFEVL